MKKLRVSLLLFTIIVLAAAQQSQQKPPATPAAAAAQPAGGPVKFTTNVQLVVEDVTVTDKSGKIIEGLTAKDFTVTEDNVPQSVAFLEFQKMEESVGPALQQRPVTVAASEPGKAKADPVTAFQIQPETPGTIRYKDRRLLVLYFDMGAMPPADQYRAMDSAIKFIKKQMSGADLMALMSFSDRLHVLQDFTDDKDALLKVLDKLFVGEDQGLDTGANDDSAADTGSSFGEDDSEFNIFNTDRQLAALQTAVKMLGQLNEKKVMVYFASGVRLNGIDNQAQLMATTNAAIRSNVSFYTVDARGLVAQAPLGDATQGSPGGQGMYSGSSAMARVGNFQKSQDTLYSLAADTGGKALLDNNDLAQGVVNAEKSIESYYILGYYSTNDKLDGKFRKVKITYNGDPTAKLSYHVGYYGGKQFSKFNAVDKERQLADALMLGDPITELTIAMEVNYFQLNSAEYFCPVAMKIPGRELALARRRGADHTVIDFIGEVKDEYGVTVTNVRDKVDIKLSGETAAQLAKQPIQYSTGFTILPGTYTIKVLARDDETGRIGTFMTKFVIPNLNKELKRVPISSVVLSGQRMDVRDALFNVATKDKLPSVDPLVQDGLRLVPSVTHVFSTNKDLYVYLQAYERGQTTEQPLV
ncbi:MAG TPA: VWA domain-containing protein, partial [Candidatus Sulfopaludibacter sp.]|nr:VWA domain-containing protein [Candidatus Sulfopaludibacter sp.]